MSRKFARKDSKHPSSFGLEWGYTTAQKQPVARSEETWSNFDMGTTTVIVASGAWRLCTMDIAIGVPRLLIVTAFFQPFASSQSADAGGLCLRVSSLINRRPRCE